MLYIRKLFVLIFKQSIKNLRKISIMYVLTKKINTICSQLYFIQSLSQTVSELIICHIMLLLRGYVVLIFHHRHDLLGDRCEAVCC